MLQNRIEKMKVELSQKSKKELVEIRKEWETELNDSLKDLKKRLTNGYSYTDMAVVTLVRESNNYIDYLRELDLIIKSKGE